MKDSDSLAVVEATRGPLVESIHYGVIAVVSADGRLLHSVGSPQTRTYLRSSAKPLQCLPFLAAGGKEKYQLTLQEVALLCASHSGSDDHARVAQQILQKIDASEADLQCGIHPPFDDEVRQRLIKNGEDPTPIRHNCSGKHSGFLAFSRLLNQPLVNYLDVDQPVQKTILNNFADFCDLDPTDVDLGVDGCSAPVFGVPMDKAALAIARLVDPRFAPPAMANACRLVVDAMLAHPDMVAGKGRFDTRLMQAGGRRWINKAGAEGYHVIGLLPGVLGEGQPGAGIALKVSDGNAAGRAITLMALETLRQLGILPSEIAKELAEFDTRPIYNWRQIEVGELRTCFTLASH